MFGKHETEVLVIGAGPVGLFSALALAARGVSVEVVEEQWRSASRSYALALHPESLRLLEELGLADEVCRIGKEVHKLRFHSARDLRAEVDLDHVGGARAHLLVLPQHQLEETLLAALERRQVPVHWSHRLSGFDEDGDRLRVRIDRLEKESIGYSVTHTEWVVSRTLEYSARFVLGADGHRSQVRRRIDLDFPAIGEPVTFAVFEFTAAAGPDDLHVVLDDDSVNVLWPLPDSRYRWSFQLKESDPAEPRVKSRLLVQFRDASFPHVGREDLEAFVAERAPWFRAQVQDVLWSAAIRFERRRAPGFGKGRVWIVGDAAHLASPVAIRSMNVGLREARDWADRTSRILRGSGSPEALSEFDGKWRQEWDLLSALPQAARAAGSADPWVEAQAGRIADCIPASGDDLKLLLGQLGITV